MHGWDIMKTKALGPMIRTIRSALKECVKKLMLKSNRLKNLKNYCTKTNLANLATIATGESVTGDH